LHSETRLTNLSHKQDGWLDIEIEAASHLARFALMVGRHVIRSGILRSKYLIVCKLVASWREAGACLIRRRWPYDLAWGECSLILKCWWIDGVLFSWGKSCVAARYFGRRVWIDLVDVLMHI